MLILELFIYGIILIILTFNSYFIIIIDDKKFIAQSKNFKIQFKGPHKLL